MPSQNARSKAAEAAAGGSDTPSAEVEVRQVSREMVVRQKIDALIPELRRALPATLADDPSRWARIALTVIRTNPKLLACTDASLLGALMVSTSLGLEPGPLGLSYWVPFWNKNVKSDEAVFILGYKGLINLARRSGSIADVAARVVYPTDAFDVEYGVEDRLHHRPNLDRDPAEQPCYFYSVARFRGEGHHIHVMNRPEVESFRARSRAKDSGPWVTDWNAMALKTVIRRAATWWPMTVEMARAINADETIQHALTAEGAVESMDTPAEFDEGGVRQLDPARDDPAARTVQGETATHPNLVRVREAAAAAGQGDDDILALIEDRKISNAPQQWTEEQITDLVTEFQTRIGPDDTTGDTK